MPRSALHLTIGAAMAVTVAAFGASGPAMADGASKNDPNCQCRFQGKRYNVGEYACIRSKMARCDMFLNNTTWTFLDDSCGSVLLDPLPQSRPATKLAGSAEPD
ncbi:MAG: hypothetical protein ACR2PM_13590 [Hyphomicrobiales bacterium]